MIAGSATGNEQALTPVPWGSRDRHRQKKLPEASTSWEEAGFGVEIGSNVQNALECLAVMTPALIVVDGKPYRPPLPPGARRAHFKT